MRRDVDDPPIQLTLDFAQPSKNFQPDVAFDRHQNVQRAPAMSMLLLYSTVCPWTLASWALW
jgi:hypothetical protein